MKKALLLLIKTWLDLGDGFGRRLVSREMSPDLEPVGVNVPYGAHRLQHIDVYRPRDGERLPVLIYVHGGGWISGDKSTYSNLCQVIAAQGFLVFNVNYRLAPAQRFPVPFQDVAQAISWVQQHAADYGGDPQHIYLSGESAGAQLVLWYATLLHDPKMQEKLGISQTIRATALRGLILYFGLYDMVDSRSYFERFFTHGFLGGEDGTSERARLASPLLHLSPDLPPSLVICGERDILFSHSVKLAKGLETCHVPVQTLFFPAREYPDAGHAFSKWPDRRCTQESLAAAARFMRGIEEESRIGSK